MKPVIFEDDSMFNKLRKQQEDMKRMFEPMNQIKTFKLHDSVITQLQNQQREWNEMIQPLTQSLLSSTLLNEVIKVQETVKPIASLLPSIAADVHKYQSQINQALTPISNLIGDNAIRMASMTVIERNKLDDLFKSVADYLNEEMPNLRSIDYTGIDEFMGDTPTLSTNSVYASNDLPSSITVATPKKSLKDMNEDELVALVRKAMTPSLIFGAFTFICKVYEDYLLDAAKVIIEIVFALLITTATGNFDAEVKAEIVHEVKESMITRDVRKVVTKYVKVNPYGDIAFLRTDSHIRKGRTKTSPLHTAHKISSNTVLTIIERRNNWLRVEIENEETCFIGWVEESKVVKFKKIK